MCRPWKNAMRGAAQMGRRVVQGACMPSCRRWPQLAAQTEDAGNGQRPKTTTCGEATLEDRVSVGRKGIGLVVAPATVGRPGGARRCSRPESSVGRACPCPCPSAKPSPFPTCQTATMPESHHRGNLPRTAEQRGKSRPEQRAARN